MEDIFGELRSVLAGIPSARQWSYLCHLLETQPEHRVEEFLLPYLERSIEKWPSHIKHAPSKWILRVSLGRPPSAWSLVRSVEISGLVFPGAYEAETSARHDALANLDNMHIIAPGVPALAMLEAMHHGKVCEKLKTLAILEWPSSPDRLVRTLRGLSFQQLEALALPRGRIDLTALEALLNIDWVRQLKRIDLSSNQLDDRAALALSRHPFEQLEQLNLAHNHITTRGARALIESKHMRALKALLLRSNQIDRRPEAFLTPTPLEDRAPPSLTEESGVYH